MKRYLLDTNICIYFLKGQYDLHQKIHEIGIDRCFISEITVAELKYGAEKSAQKEKNRAILEDFLSLFTVLPIFTALDVYAKEKARLKSAGKILDDFDLLIGATAITYSLVLATKNISDFNRLDGIQIEDLTS